MYLFDFIFLKTFEFSRKFKDDSGAKWSSMLFTGLYFAFTIIILISTAGLLFENFISSLMKSHSLIVWMTIGALGPVIMGIRYYWFTGVKELTDKNNRINPQFKRLVNLFTYLMLITIPVLTFCLYRLLIFGQLKWW